MLTPQILGALAGRLGREKRAVKMQRGRSGRTCKGPHTAKQLEAAGSARQDVKGVLSYPRGRNV